MTETENATFLTALPDEQQLASIVIHTRGQRRVDEDDEDDDIDIDVKSSADSGDTPTANNEIEEILKNDEPEEVSLAIATQPADALADKMSHDDPSPSAAGEQLQTFIPRAVYDYAAKVHETLEGPRQNKLDQDITAVLGSSDPPPGFGFLHPRFYYLEQKRPVPMEPLRVWRGYNGHVYFSPIQVKTLDADRAISPTRSRKLTAGRTGPTSAKVTVPNRAAVSAYPNQKPFGQRIVTSKVRAIQDRSPTSRRTDTRTTTNEQELNQNTLATFIEGTDSREETTPSGRKMWHSIVTCVPVQIKPMSKRTQHAIEDLQAFQKEQNTQDPTSYQRPVLPHIRPIPKSKFLYKGLAYKEVKKVPGVQADRIDENSAGVVEKPLIDYNLAQAYIRYEENLVRKQRFYRSAQSAAQPTPMIKGPLNTPSQASVDLREIRKRIVKGTTLSHHPLSQANSWTPGRAEPRSALGSESALQRPSTTKSSIPRKQTATVEMPILTKYLSRSRSTNRHTPTTEDSA